MIDNLLDSQRGICNRLSNVQLSLERIHERLVGPMPKAAGSTKGDGAQAIQSGALNELQAMQYDAFRMLTEIEELLIQFDSLVEGGKARAHLG